jgi:uncharacterized repeat protein (TIGR01451 family)
MRPIHALLLSLLWAAPAWAQAPTPECPVPGDDTQAQIEVLDFAVEGNTCQGFQDIVSSYGGVCRIQRATYSGPDAIYKVRLNPGHERVTFRLDMEPPADLVLALLRQCGQGASCVSSSPDFIGSRAEEISAASYPPGIYYLVIDSAGDQEGRCGAYRLTVTGVNPTPDLILELTSSPAPVVAGEILTYTMTVTNGGALEATNVQVIQTLPAEFHFVSASPGCDSIERGRIRCSRDRLAVGAPASWPIVVRVKVDPATRNLPLRSTATVRALEGDPTPSNNTREVTTAVIARSDLSIKMSQSRDSVVAGDGQPLTYTLRVRNAGPSDATQAVVTDDLPKDVSFVSAPGCAHAGGQVTCTIGRLAATASVEKEIKVNVKPSAQGLLNNTARVAVLGEINPADNVTTRTTGVIRKTDLSVTMTGPDLVAAGEDLTYAVVVENLGPSDSAGARVTDDPPQFLCVFQSNVCKTERVTFSTGPIPRGGKKNLSIQARVDSSLRRPPPQPISNEVRVAPEDPREQDPNGDNDTKTVKTRVVIQADLELVSKTATPVSDLADPDPGPVVAGENLLYTLKVQNNGPSYSNGGMISDTLASSLKYVSSPDDCGEEDGGVVSCRVPALPPDDGAHGCASATPTSCFEARFVVKVLAGATAAIGNRASVKGVNDDPEPANNAKSSTPTAVEQKADLAVVLSGSPEVLAVPGELTYTVTVTNAGPSLAVDVLAILELPDGASLAALEPDCKVRADAVGVVECHFGDLMAGSFPVTRSVRVTIPAITSTRIATATVMVSSDTPEPAAHDNTAQATTTLAIASEADLTVEKSASAAVPTGAPLFYTLVVSNRGPAEATGVRVEDRLPGGTFSSDPTGCARLESGNLVVWTVGDLDKDAEQRCTFTVAFQSPGFYSNKAIVTSPDVSDPDLGNNTSQVTTVVFGGITSTLSLILPYFEADRDPAGVATLFAVRNPSDSPVCARYDYLLAGQLGPGGSELSCIASRAVDTRNLRDLHLGDGQVAVGHVEITPTECRECGSIPCTGCIESTDLTGDFFRVDSSGAAGGELLLSADPTRHPPDLCRRWDVRFLNSSSFAGDTEFVFFVPDNRGGSTPVATGKVYNEAGDFVQTISVESSEEAFHRTTEDLLASAGAIEWTFRDGLDGNVSTIHRGEGNAVAIPGVCRRPPADQPLGDEKPLLLPYFSVDRSNPDGATTLFAVRNRTDREVQVRYEYFSSDDTLQFGESKPLAGHATRTVNLRDIPGPTTGFVRITAVPDPSAPERLEQILSGDYIRLAPVPLRSHPDLAAGSALIDTDPQRSPRQLCHRWDVRFIKNARSSRETFFAFFLDEPTSGPVATGKVFRKDGTLLTTISLDAPPGPLVAFEKSAADLGLDSGEGSIEWDLGPLGHVATLFKSGGSFGTILVPGVCRDTP